MHRGTVRILTAGSVQMLRDLLGRQSCHGAINAVKLHRVVSRVSKHSAQRSGTRRAWRRWGTFKRPPLLLPRSEEFFDCAAYPSGEQRSVALHPMGRQLGERDARA